MSVQFPPDLTAPVGQMRALIPDMNPEYFLFQDETLALYFQLETTVRSGVALALETAASNGALVDKVMELHDLKTDSQKTAQTLMERAALLRSQDDESVIIQFGDLTAFNAREYWQKNGRLVRNDWL